MTNAVSAISAAASTGVTSNVSTSAQPMTVGHQTEVTPAEARLGDLTAADWQLVSASVGKDVGPDASGKIQPLQPILAFMIEAEREAGSLASGQELTLSDMKNMAANQQSSGVVNQIENVISYLEQSLQTSSGSTAGRKVNITA